jgi:hypothetical protein
MKPFANRVCAGLGKIPNNLDHLMIVIYKLLIEQCELVSSRTVGERIVEGVQPRAGIARRQCQIVRAVK